MTDTQSTIDDLTRQLKDAEQRRARENADWDKLYNETCKAWQKEHNEHWETIKKLQAEHDEYEAFKRLVLRLASSPKQ